VAGSAQPDLDAGTIVGLLADADRRRVVAALILGAGSPDAVAERSGLGAERANRALGRLVDGGLVVATSSGLAVQEDAFQRAARDALARPRSAEHAGEPDERRRVLDVFVRDGAITSVPTARSKRLVVLDWLVQSFEPGTRYSEREVNEIIAARHPDTAALRRYLVDEGMLDRDAGEYWRSGGSVTTR
jgi:hypothetical protein